MNYGMQLSASGVLTSLYRMDVLANNLANVGTVGFKPDSPVTVQRDAASVEDHLHLPSNKMLERLGAGVMLAPNRTNFEQGALSKTDNPLDLAIEGEGFFLVRDQAGESGERIRLTRDGRFTRTGDGTLVSAANGKPLLDISNRPIVITDGSPITIGPDGTIHQKGAAIAQIQVAAVPDSSMLGRVGNGMFRASSETMKSLKPATGQVKQGVVESAAVDPVTAMLAISDAGRQAEANFGLIASQDRLLERAINGLGRVA